MIQRTLSNKVRNKVGGGKAIMIIGPNIGDFNEFSLRTDKGALWENFLISERVKQNEYKLSLAKTLFLANKQRRGMAEGSATCQ